MRKVKYDEILKLKRPHQISSHKGENNMESITGNYINEKEAILHPHV